MGNENADVMLGKLVADTEESKKQRDKLFTKLDDVSKAVAKLEGCIQRQGVTLAKIVPIVEDYQKTKNKGIGALIGAGFVGGSGGAGLIGWFAGLFK